MNRPVPPPGCREARWFAPGDVDVDVRGFGEARRRVDSYHLPSLGLDVSLKRRGEPPALEHKRRLGRVELITFCGADGFAERWVKQRLPRRERPDGGAWCDVAKEVWVDAGIEVARVRIDGECFWTVCVDVTQAVEPPRKAREPLRSLLAHAEAGSYAAFILACQARRAPALLTARAAS